MYTPMSVFERMYASEINFTIETFWDDSYSLCLGDNMNGYRATNTVRTWAEVEPWFEANAARLWPNSDFANGV